MRFTLLIFIVNLHVVCNAQTVVPHVNAHAHNDYEHIRPLFEAMMNGFTSVEADVHLREGKLLVSHNQPGKNAKVLEVLYLNPLDSLLKLNQGHIYLNSTRPFYLMIDCKTEAETTFQAIRNLLAKYPALNCSSESCGVKIFLSGNRPLSTMIKEGYSGIGIDGRPDDLGKGYTSEQMPVISDHYRNWSSWNGKSIPSEKDLLQVKELAKKVHDEGKKLRLWAIPDNEIAWNALLETGVDLINTDRLPELNAFLIQKGF